MNRFVWLKLDRSIIRKDDDSWKLIADYKHLIYIMRLINFWEMKTLKSHLKENYIQNFLILLLTLWIQQSDMHSKLCIHFQQNRHNS